MDFTREPVIETIITPKEGHKLIIRSTDNQEEYSVDAVEVVSFGQFFFFRSLERPKAFLLPMTKYEVIETRKIRAVLKKPQVEKGIKIGEGKKVVGTTTPPQGEVVEEDAKKHERKRVCKQRSKPEKKEEEKVISTRYTLLPPPTSLISEQIERYKHYLVEHGALLSEEVENKGEKVITETEKSPSRSCNQEVPLSENSAPTVNEESNG